MTNSPIGFLGDPGIEEFFGIYGSYSQIKIPTITNIPRRIDVKVENNTFQLYEYGTNNPFTDDLIQSISYEFHLADSSNLGYTFWFSETEDGIHNGGTNFTETAGKLGYPGVGSSGTPGITMYSDPFFPEMQWEILPFTYYKIPTTDEVIHEIKVKVENGKFVLYEENGIDLFTEKFVTGRPIDIRTTRPI